LLKTTRKMLKKKIMIVFRLIKFVEKIEKKINEKKRLAKVVLF
jgi:hypothetical protein